MTNAPDDFTLDDELATTETWDDGFESGYADDPGLDKLDDRGD